MLLCSLSKNKVTLVKTTEIDSQVIDLQQIPKHPHSYLKELQMIDFET